MSDRNAPPAVSVLMPVYNAARYVGVAIESILGQTFADFEFIIIDDGSTDGGLDILRRYAAQDPRIRLVSRENRGLVNTLNEGIGLAHAPLIARMDADDISLPERLEKQVDFMASHPEVVACGTNYVLIDERGRQFTDGMSRYHGNDSVQERLLMGDCVISHPSVMVRTEAIREVDGYRQGFPHAEDLDLWLRLGEKGRLDVLAAVLLRYRDHVGSVSTSHHAHQVATFRRVCEAAWARRGEVHDFINKGWRPRNRREMSDSMARRGWYGFLHGRRGMALEYGVRALLQAPQSRNAWKLLACALLKRAEKGEGVPPGDHPGGAADG